MNEEFCIIPEGHVVAKNGHIYRWYNRRMRNLSRHEIFFGANRQKSIKYGLVVFIMPEDHNMSEYGVHGMKGHSFDRYLKELGQKTAMDYYGWSEEDFIKIFGRSYL